jgi:glycosyltransferase involved in cell wall biosynthesis
MNVLFLSEVTAANARSGAERTLREQVLGLSKRGHAVSVVTRTMAEDPRLTVSVDGATEHRYPFSRRNEVAFVLSSVVGSLRTLNGAAVRHDFDAALIHQSLAGLGPIIFKRARARRWVYMCLSLAHEEYLSRNKQGKTPGELMLRRLNAYGRWWVERAVMRRCSRVIVMSDFMRKRVLAAHHIPEGKLCLLPGAADHRKFHPATDRASIRRQLGLPTDRMVLFTVRNLGPRMGLEGEELRDVLVLIGGEGPLRPMLEGLIRSLDLTGRVRLLGFIPEEYLPRYYQAADLMLLPTAELEGFGLVTVEALACGTPVLGTSVGATQEILAQVDPGLLTEGHDPGAIAKGVRRLLRLFRERPEERVRLSSRGRRLVEETYTWDLHAEKLERILEEVNAEV